MLANYHTHTWRCNHAEGTEEEYVLSAMERGLTILGFSDHTPYPFPQPYVSTFRMEMSQYEEYVTVIQGLKEKYEGQIQIYLGLETEYYPKYFSQLLEKLRSSPLEYLILGQHFVGNEIGDVYSGSETGDVEVLRRYCYQAMDAMNTGLFTYFAHPDLIRFSGDPKLYRKYMTEMCQEAKNCRIPLEINLLGLRQQRWYPRSDFWEIAGETGCQAILGTDAHAPWHLTELDSEEKARALAERNHLRLLQSVELRSI